VPAGPDGEAFTVLFAKTKIEASTTPDFQSRAWQKLCLNSAGAVSTLTQAPTGIAWSLRLEAIVRALVEECAAVARAEGAMVPSELVDLVVERAAKSTSGANSMQDDRFAGRQMEIDARNGAIVRFGKKHGIPTPMNELFLTLLEASRSPWAHR
jgi:2-dehydropantoate 2-reductase